MKKQFVLAVTFAFFLAIASAGCSPNTKADQYTKDLIDACLTGKIDQVAALLKKGANVNAIDTAGLTPLLVAAYKNNGKLATLLLDSGADPNLGDPQHGITPLDTAAKRNSLDVAQILLDRKANINSKDNIGETPLFEAAAWGSLEMVRFLLDHGARVNEKSNPDTGDTALIVAASYSRLDVVNLLLSKGADGSIKDSKGKTYTDYLKANADAQRYWLVVVQSRVGILNLWFDSKEKKLVRVLDSLGTDIVGDDNLKQKGWFLAGGDFTMPTEIILSPLPETPETTTKFYLYIAPNKRALIVLKSGNVDGVWDIKSRQPTYKFPLQRLD